MIRAKQRYRRNATLRRLCVLFAVLAVGGVNAQTPADNAANVTVRLSADSIRMWERQGTKFLLLEGNCFLAHTGGSIRASECLVWTPAEAPAKGVRTTLHILAKGDVRYAQPSREIEHLSRLSVDWQTTEGYNAAAGKDVIQGPAEDHPLYKLAAQSNRLFRDAKVDPQVAPTAAQVQEPVGNLGVQPQPSGDFARPRGGLTMPRPSRDPNARRLLTLNPRSSKQYQLENFNNEAGEEMAVVTGGVTISIEEPASGNLATIATDRAVIWRRGQASGAPENPAAQDVSQQRVEIYLEGNVQLNLGNSNNLSRNQQVQLVGKQVYFDVNREQALVLEGTLETYDERLRAPLLMNADRMFMFTQDKFFGERSSFTTSPYRGKPGYEFTASEFYIDRVKQPVVNPFTGVQAVDSNGQPLSRTRNFGTGYSNILRVDDVPIFYTPYLRADVEHPLGPIETIKIGNTQRLGFTASVTLDAWRLLGLDYLEVAERFNWLFDVGYYSARGPAGGTRVTYFSREPVDQPGAYYGRFLTWWIHDAGTDFLGPDRNGLIPPEEFRGRALFQHKQYFDNDITLLASFAYLSDQNFLQSFFQNDYDTAPDQETIVYLKQARDFWGWSVFAQPRVNDFLPQNEALPRADLHILGKSLLADRLSYFSRSSVGYYEVSPPALTTPLGTPTFDTEVQTARVDTRHELDLPLRVGDLSVVPYAVGQFTGYNEAIDGDPLGRLYGAGGVRATLPIWRAFPNVQSSLFNLQGLAHKINVYADYQYALASEDRDALPYIDQLDDDTSELVRRTNLHKTFLAKGKPLPVRYDPRFEGTRRDLYFASPEAIDDLHVVRAGLNQRLQTKRGPIGGERIIDWMTLDTNASYFLDADRDNLGKPFGLLDYTYRWHVGDRTSLLSTGVWEPVDGTNSYNATIAIQRPPRSLLSLFYSHYSSGPFDSDFVGFNSSYRFSHKYAGFVAAAIDIAQLDQVSYQFGFTRIGLDFITHLTVNYNAGRKDFGFRFEILPRVAPRNAYGRGIFTTLPYGIEPGEATAPVALDRLNILQNTTSQPF